MADDPLDLDDDDAQEIGERVVSMADRVRVMHTACPGVVATWRFEMDGIRYRVSVGVDQGETKEEVRS